MALKMDKNSFSSGLQNAAASAGEDFPSVPNGTYIFRLKDIVYGINKKQNPMVTEVWTVMTGDQKGKDHKLFTNVVTDKGFNEMGVKILMGRWKAMGYDVASISEEEDFKKACKDVAGDHPMVQASIYDNAAKPQFKNFRIDALVDSASTPAAPEAGTEEEPAGDTEAAPEETAAPAKGKRGRRPNASKAAPEPTPAAEEEPADEPADEPAGDEPAAEEEQAQLVVGAKVAFTKNGANLEGTVKKIEGQDKIEIHYKSPKDGKVYKAIVKLEEIAGVISEK